MKQLRYIAAFIVGSAIATACVDEFNVGESFLEKAPGVDVNIDTVFSKAEYTRNFLWSAYGQLYSTYKKGNMMNATSIDALTDSYYCYCTWGGPYQTYYPGLFTEDSQDNPNGNLQGKFAYKTGNPDGDARVSIYECVRKCWQIIENIDKLPDSEMSSSERSRLKGEAYTIMASRYFDAFRNFGGLCLVKKAYGVGEGFEEGRATALETVNYIDTLIQRAIAEPGFIWNIDNSDVGQWSGRLTRASAYALRCKVWMHAASPLFNSDQPYMQYESGKETEFTDIHHVWFGKYDASLWQKCLDCCNAFFTENKNNGDFYQLVMPTTNDEAGYRMAFRNAYRYRNNENRHEKLFDVHMSYTMSDGSWGWGWKGFCLDGIRQGGAVPTNELMECFGTSDGVNFDAAYGDIYGAGKNPKGIDIFADRDPRLYETMAVPRETFPSGTVGDYCGKNYIDTWYNGALLNNSKMNGNQDDVASGYRKFKWFLDYDKMDDQPIGVPYIRLAEVYLIQAEALAELGQLKEALVPLNVIRSRVGLGKIEEKNPTLNLTSNKDNLINEILRERNCEIGAECGDRLYDMIRRKRQDLFTKPLHEIRIYPLNADGSRNLASDTQWDSSKPWPKFEYETVQITKGGGRVWWKEGYWTNKWYLDPVSRIEIQKGYGLTQNPGW